MKIALFFGIIFLTMPFQLNAQSNYYVKVGKTTSNLRHERLEDNRAILFGGGYIKSFKRLPHVFIDFEMRYAEKRGTLRNKSHPISMYGYGVIFDDIHISLGYLEFAAMPGLSVRIINDKRFRISVGPALSTRIVNRTYYIWRRTIQLHNADEMNNYKFDYYLVDYELPNIPEYLRFIKLFYITFINLNISAALSFGPLDFEFQYSRALLEDKHYTDLTINDKMDSFYIGLSYNFCLTNCRRFEK